MADDQTKSEKKRNVQYQRSSIFYVSMMYFKRFFLTRSILNYNIFGMIGACILLACKVFFLNITKEKELLGRRNTHFSRWIKEFYRWLYAESYI